MEFKGTKGIWSCEKDFDKNYDQPTIKINSSAGISGICTVWSGNDDELDDETKANAKLISKSPEMLAMLLRIKEAMRSLDNLEEGWEDELNDLNQLITEATTI